MNSASADAQTLERLLDPLSRCIRGDGETDLLNLRADPKLTERIQELADRCDEGELSSEEAAEYETYVAYGNFIALLQAKARYRRTKAAAE